MGTPSRDLILDEIRRTAEANGGQSLGRSRFEQETEISSYDWGRHWARFGDAVREAGYEPNAYNQAIDLDALLTAYAAVVRRLGHVPTGRELRIERSRDSDVPVTTTLQRRCGGKREVLQALVDHFKDRPDYADVREICLRTLDSSPARQSADAVDGDATGSGFVYLIKGRGGEYKLGRTGLVDRRVSQLATGSSVELEVVHEIRTDDPAGVEAYWHRRFADRRLRGEWFKLSAADVRAVKRWRRIF